MGVRDGLTVLRRGLRGRRSEGGISGAARRGNEVGHEDLDRPDNVPRGRPRGTPRRHVFNRTVSRRASYLALAAVVIATVAVDVHRFRPAGSTSSPAPAATSAAVGSVTPSDKTGPVDFTGRLHAQIETALAAREFPALIPSIADLPKNKAPQWAGCATTGPSNATQCVYGKPRATRTVAVLGDSIALSWLPGLIDAFGTHGYRVYSFVAEDCPASNVDVGVLGEAAKCDAHRDWALAAIKALRPNLIVVSDASATMMQLQQTATGSSAVSQWQVGATRTLKALATVAETVVLSSPPGSGNLEDCATGHAVPANCVGSLTKPEVTALRTAEVPATKATGTRFIDTSSWFCGEHGQCPSFVGTTPVYVDGIQLTRQYSAYLAPALEAAIKP